MHAMDTLLIQYAFILYIQGTWLRIMHGSNLCNIYSNNRKVQIHKQNLHKLGGSKVNKNYAYTSSFAES